MAKVTFDGANKLIIVNSGITSLDVKIDLYSEWKNFVTGSDNSKYVAAFRAFGNDPLGGNLFAGSFFFLQNQAGSDGGWRIRPQETNHELTIVGNLYGEDSTLPLFASTLGNFTVPIFLERSSLTQTVSLTPWDDSRLDTYAAGTFGEVMQKLYEQAYTGRIR